MAAAGGAQDMDLENGNTDHDYDYQSELRKVKSAGAVTISPELFERVCSCRLNWLIQ
jgi:hypothetical protein